ncbi:MAG: PEP-CTERM sorting domain-containing protein [Desulfobacterales bacterium]|nr:PEP-CTERM sorting domain-containing protein [Desulfobacterales bacterium]
MKKFTFLLIFSLLACFNAQASTILGSSISSPQGNFGFPNDLNNAVDQSGLSANYISGVTDFDTFVAGTTHDDTNSLNSGFTSSSAPPGQFTFDLGTTFTVDAFAFWEAANPGSLTGFDLYADTDSIFGNGGLTLIGNFNPTGGGFGAPQPSSAQVFGFSSTTTQYLHIDVLSIQGGSNLIPGVGEIAFRGSSPIPEPTTMLLFGFGLIGFAGVSRRKNSSNSEP